MSILDDIVSRQNIWNSSALLNYTIGVLLIGAAILASTAVTVFTEQLDKKHIKILAFVAAVCTALTAALNPLAKGAAFRQAWSHVDAALFDHKADPAKFPASEVVKAVREGQLIINRANAPAPPPDNPTSTSKK